MKDKNKMKTEEELSFIAEGILREHGLAHIINRIIVKRELIGDNTVGLCVKLANKESFIVVDPLYLDKNPDLIESILAHELAHALAFKLVGDHQHENSTFVRYLHMLGGIAQCPHRQPVKYSELYAGNMQQKEAECDTVYEHNKNLRTLRELVISVARGNTKSLVVISGKGMGKSTTVRETLKQNSVRFDIISGHETPLNFYFRLYKLVEMIQEESIQERFIVVLDDASGLIDNTSHRSGLALLKSCLWQEDGVRKIAYNNIKETKAMAIPTSFGLPNNVKFIMLMNDVSKGNKDVKAVLSRTYVYEMTPSFTEILSTMRAIIRATSELTPQEKNELIECIEQGSRAQPDKLDLRICKKAVDIIQDYNQGIFTCHWRELVTKQLWVC